MTSRKRQASQEVNRGLAIGQQLGRWFVQSLTFKMFSPLAFPLSTQPLDSVTEKLPQINNPSQ